MIDILFNFGTNDIDVSILGDIRMTETCSAQNAALFINKTVINLESPDLGIGFEEKFPNMPKWKVPNMMEKAKSQVYDDGASDITYNIEQIDNVGTYRLHTECVYKTEKNTAQWRNTR